MNRSPEPHAPQAKTPKNSNVTKIKNLTTLHVHLFCPFKLLFVVFVNLKVLGNGRLSYFLFKNDRFRTGFGSEVVKMFSKMTFLPF